MMETQIVELIRQMGFAGIFAAMWLYERRRCSVLADRHIEDLREMAGLKPRLALERRNGGIKHDVPPLSILPTGSGD